MKNACSVENRGSLTHSEFVSENDQQTIKGNVPALRQWCTCYCNVQPQNTADNNYLAKGIDNYG